MKLRFLFVLLALAFSCKEEITPLVPPNDGNNGGNGGNGGNGSDDCTLPQVTPVAGKYANCLPVLSDTTLDIVTWNAENFPKTSGAITSIHDIIDAFDPDIIAFQEISSVTSFNQLIASLPGWSGLTGSGSLRVAYAYKTAEVTLLNTAEIFKDDASAFPRPPLVATAQHVSGKQVTLMNLHLKCCDDGNSIPRRQDASAKLKAHLDSNYPSTSVVVLGDMNEDITQPEGNSVFTNFIDDAADYRFADMKIAACDEANWSYPDWPSHIDHLLITNELFDKVTDVRTLKLRDCDTQFKATVTDHHPVLMRLNMK